jgi:hypothetical protein
MGSQIPKGLNDLSFIKTSINELESFKKLYDEVTEKEGNEEKLNQVNTLLDQAMYRMKHGMTLFESIARLKKDIRRVRD